MHPNTVNYIKKYIQSVLFSWDWNFGCIKVSSSTLYKSYSGNIYGFHVVPNFSLRFSNRFIITLL